MSTPTTPPFGFNKMTTPTTLPLCFVFIMIVQVKSYTNNIVRTCSCFLLCYLCCLSNNEYGTIELKLILVAWHFNSNLAMVFIYLACLCYGSSFF